VDGGAVVRVDPLTGDRTLLSDDRHGTQGDIPFFRDPSAIAVEVDRDHSLVVMDIELGVVRVDPVSGDRTLVSGGRSGRGKGGHLLSPAGLAVESNGFLVLAEEGGVPGAFAVPPSVVRVDPRTDDRTLRSGCLEFACSSVPRGSGPLFALSGPGAIAVEA